MKKKEIFRRFKLILPRSGCPLVTKARCEELGKD